MAVIATAIFCLILPIPKYSPFQQTSQFIWRGQKTSQRTFIGCLSQGIYTGPEHSFELEAKVKF